MQQLPYIVARKLCLLQIVAFFSVYFYIDPSNLF